MYPYNIRKTFIYLKKQNVNGLIFLPESTDFLLFKKSSELRHSCLQRHDSSLSCSLHLEYYKYVIKETSRPSG